MSTKNPKYYTKGTETPADAESAELADDQLQDASGGMIFVKIPKMGDASVKADDDDAPSSADDRFNGKYFLEGVTHSYTHRKPSREA